MAPRAALVLLLLAFGGGQADEDWLSIKQWYSTCTLTYTYSGKTSSMKGGFGSSSEWTETESATLESVLDTRSPSQTILRKAAVAAYGKDPLSMIKPGRWQAWHPGPRPDRPASYVVSGESESSSTETSPGEASLPISDREVSQKSRIGTGVLPLALTRIQIDREKKTYAIGVPLLRVMGDPAIVAIQSSRHEHSQPSGYRETRNETLRGGAVVNGKVGVHPDVEVSGTDLLVFDQALPDKVAALSGSIEIPLVPGRERKGKAEKEVKKAVLTWTFSPTPPPPIELEIEVADSKPDAWPAWRPKATWDPNVHGSTVDVVARVVTPGGPLPDKPVKIALRLAEVSSEPGVCMNFPEQNADLPPNNRPDLRFIPEGSAKVRTTDLAAWVVEPDPPELRARLAAYDWGAWGDVVAEARLESGRILIGHLKGKPTEKRLLVPDREPDSRIARVWKSPGRDDEDLDDQPAGDGQAGDGFSNYEEYRGFRVDGVWKEGDPAKKELFVRNEVPMAAAGVDLFEKLTQLRVHRVRPGEIRSGDWRVNFNQGHAHVVDQHGLRIFFDPSLKNECWAESKDGKGPGMPRYIKGIHYGSFDNRVIAVTDGPVRSARMYADVAMAHELLHSCNVYHHGDKPGESLPRRWTRDPSGKILEAGTVIQVFDEAGNDISAKLTVGNSLDVDLKIREQGGLSSGDVSCVMRYEESQGYVLPGSGDRRVRLGPGDPPEPTGGGLCTSPAATGTNVTPGRFGPADTTKNRGACASQFVVNDGAVRTSRK